MYLDIHDFFDGCPSLLLVLQTSKWRKEVAQPGQTRYDVVLPAAWAGRPWSGRSQKEKSWRGIWASQAHRVARLRGGTGGRRGREEGWGGVVGGGTREIERSPT